MADNEGDFLRFVSEETEDIERLDIKFKPWKIIVADDDEEVHAVTSLALSSFQYKGRGLEIISAYSADQTEQLIRDNPDTAVILLDVVMENHDSGLKLVKYIREAVGNTMVRIILRTGQPGYAPEMEVIYNYDINDYKEKTELTSAKLVTTLIASIRNFDDLKQIEESRKSLEIVAAGSADMHSLKDQHPFDSFIPQSLDAVLNSFSPQKEISILNGRVLNVGGERKLCVCSGTGDFKEGCCDNDASGMIPHFIQERIHSEDLKDIEYYDDCCIFRFRSTGGAERFIFIKNLPVLEEIKKNIIRTYSTHISTVYNNIELMEEQKKKEEEIRKSLDEKLILVKEVHHRVKNNLQIISSLLHMQAAGIDDPKLLNVLRESENRVQSMSLVHEKLYQSDLMATIDFNEYLSSLAERLISTYSVSSSIHLEMDTDPLMLSINTAIPCGLIVNEILTNSIKYAFPLEQNGIISISMKVNNKDVVLKLSDNGVGLPKDFNVSQLNSLGTKLIKVLTDQIDGILEVESVEGTAYTLRFSESEEIEASGP